MLMADFGWYLANVESDAEEAKDGRDKFKDEELIRLLSSVDDDTGKKYSVAKAERMASLSDEYTKLNDEYRNLTRAHRIIKRKYDSVAKSFDGIRSRLSVIKRDSEV